MIKFNRTTTNRMRTGVGALVAATMALAVGGFASAANADLLAYWHVNHNSFPDIIQSDVGSGFIDTSNYGGSTVNRPGTSLNLLPGFPDGQALSFEGDPGSENAIDFVVSMSGYQDLSMSFAVMKGNASHAITGSEWWWATSDDPENFTKMEDVDTTPDEFVTWELKEVDFASIAQLNDADTVILRLVVHGVPGTLYAHRYDNIQIHANAIPAPGALALLGLAGLCCSRCRRAY